jgi:hypothetical protein
MITKGVVPMPLEHEHILSTLARGYLFSGRSSFATYLPTITKKRLGFSAFTPYVSAYDDIAECCDRHSLHLERHSPSRYFSLFSQREGNSRPIGPGYMGIVKGSDIWRICIECIDEDIDLLGIPIFHLPNQLPAIRYCYKHHLKLILLTHNDEYISLKTFIVHRNKIISNLKKQQNREYLSQESDLIQWLHLISWKLLKVREVSSEISIQSEYKEQIGLASIDRYMTLHQRNRLIEMQNEIEMKIGIDHLKSIFTIYGNRQRQQVISLYHAAYKPPDYVHPIIHLLIIYWLQSINKGMKSEFLLS